MTSIVWFRQDLRIQDNPALAAAAARGPVIPVFILDEEAASEWRLGGASRWWLHHSLTALRERLGGLALFRGPSTEVLRALVENVKPTAVYWNRCYEPYAITRDKHVKASLQKSGVDARSFNAGLLHEPWELSTAAGSPFKVYTPFWRASLAKPVSAPSAAPTLDVAVPSALGDSLDEWRLLPTRPNWAEGWTQLWKPGEAGARVQLEDFMRNGLAYYAESRDRPDMRGTSRLSPHLHWGEVSPRQIWARIAFERENASMQKGADKLLSELGWREFAHHLLYHFPTLPRENWRREFDSYPWKCGGDDLKAWQRGQTGYPIVDAGMRELWATGWTHNRVRMITASFLVKHLQIHWRHGEAWFWDTLVDADLANNASGWQWVAGSGADASPYFRMFNPIVQGEKFDPNGDYVRRWCPELAGLPKEFIHQPFNAPPEVLASAGIELTQNYPWPLVNHGAARKAALAGYARIRSAKLM
ncbi:MAG TPA: deoxyribodipyrimidine photo-lyase [Xanthobacteraceae bacterium]|jgi:deoxyribodipyrimidine photo-lyase|nr:deoxyribodipyrimidine photo-lyase [Xanthobacteraceae bacterium]